METFFALLALCAGNSPVTGEFPTQRQVTRNFDVFFDTSSWVNNRDVGDMRRYRASYDVTVMNAPSYLDFVFIIRFIRFMRCLYEYFAFTVIALHPGLKVILKDAILAHWILLQIE